MRPNPSGGGGVLELALLAGGAYLLLRSPAGGGPSLLAQLTGGGSPVAGTASTIPGQLTVARGTPLPPGYAVVRTGSTTQVIAPVPPGQTGHVASVYNAVVTAPASAATFVAGTRSVWAELSKLFGGTPAEASPLVLSTVPGTVVGSTPLSDYLRDITAGVTEGSSGVPLSDHLRDLVVYDPSQWTVGQDVPLPDASRWGIGTWVAGQDVALPAETWDVAAWSAGQDVVPVAASVEASDAWWDPFSWWA